MKNLTNRFVSFMLVFALALSLSAPAFAAEYSGTNELNNEVDYYLDAAGKIITVT